MCLKVENRHSVDLKSGSKRWTKYWSDLVETLVWDLRTLCHWKIPEILSSLAGDSWVLTIVANNQYFNYLVENLHLSDGPSLASCQSPWSVSCGQSESESSRSWGQLTEIAFTPTSASLSSLRHSSAHCLKMGNLHVVTMKSWKTLWVNVWN